MMPVPMNGAALWTAEQMRQSAGWLYQLDQSDIEELTLAVRRHEESERELESVTMEHFSLPGLGPSLSAMRQQILFGPGVLQMRGLPVQQLGRRRSAIAFWGISAHLAEQVVSQNAKGHLLGHVKDMGQSLDQTTSRGPYTRDRIEYHSDACDVVGLLCLHPAKSGGESSLASAWSVYNRMLDMRLDCVESLCQPLFRDRRGEVPDGYEPWYAMPVFNHFNGFLAVCNEPSYIKSVARFFERDPNTPLQHEALALLDRFSDELRLDIAFEMGDMQFINNHTILHSRHAFEDYDEPERKRHLLRIWRNASDGPLLPESYFARNGDPGCGRRPGGIWGSDTRPSAQLDGL